MALILSGDTGVPASGMPTGSVIQTVIAYYTGQPSTTSTSMADTGLTATITPTSSTSKILVIPSMAGVSKNGGNTAISFQIVRGVTTIYAFENLLAFTNSTAYNSAASTTTYLDSPATTSPTTYKIQWALSYAAGTGYLNNNASGGFSSSITLLEIKQ